MLQAIAQITTKQKYIKKIYQFKILPLRLCLDGRKEIERKEVERKEVEWKEIKWIYNFYRYIWMKGK